VLFAGNSSAMQLCEITIFSCLDLKGFLELSIQDFVIFWQNHLIACRDLKYCTLFADSLREMYVYSGQDKKVDLTTSASPSAQEHILMKLFRAQRNFYITGISLFLLMWVLASCLT
jgi:hypothetical protein